MAGARATGNLAMIAMQNVATADARAVAVKTDSLLIPACERMSGFTAKMYDIVKKVVIPATISVLIVVWP